MTFVSCIGEIFFSWTRLELYTRDNLSCLGTAPITHLFNAATEALAICLHLVVSPGVETLAIQLLLWQAQLDVNGLRDKVTIDVPSFSRVAHLKEKLPLHKRKKHRSLAKNHALQLSPRYLTGIQETAKLPLSGACAHLLDHDMSMYLDFRIGPPILNQRHAWQTCTSLSKPMLQCQQYRRARRNKRLTRLCILLA